MITQEKREQIKERVISILEQNPELAETIYEEGPASKPTLKMVVRLALCKTTEQVNAVAREYKSSFMFIDRPLSKGFVKIYG